MQSESVEHLIRQRFPTFSLSIYFLLLLLPRWKGKELRYRFSRLYWRKKENNGVLPYLLRFGGGGREATRKIRGVKGDALQDDVSGWVVLFFHSLSLLLRSFFFFFWRRDPIANGLGRVTLERRQWRWRSFEDRSFSHWNSIQDPAFSFTLLRRVTFGRRRKERNKIVFFFFCRLLLWEANSAFECWDGILNNVSVNQSGNGEIDGGIERWGWTDPKLTSFSFGRFNDLMLFGSCRGTWKRAWWHLRSVHPNTQTLTHSRTDSVTSGGLLYWMR